MKVQHESFSAQFSECVKNGNIKKIRAPESKEMILLCCEYICVCHHRECVDDRKALNGRKGPLWKRFGR